MRLLRSVSSRELLDVKYCERFEFDGGVLPLEKHVMEVMMYLLSPQRAGKNCLTKEKAAEIVANCLVDHWIFCNVYTMSWQTVQTKVLRLYEEFNKKTHARSHHKNAPDWELKAKAFNERLTSTLFDIKVKDKTSQKRQEELYGVKMTEVEEAFYLDQRSDRNMFCETAVDRKWKKMEGRRLKREQGIKKMIEREKEAEQRMEKVSIDNVPVDGDTNENLLQNMEDGDFVDEEDTATRKRKREFVSSGKDDDPLPPQYQHIRVSQRKVKPEYYRVVDKLVSKYHMSLEQATGGVVEVGNYMFGRSWKSHDTESETFDLDTVPAKTNNRVYGKALEAFTLAKISEQILSSDQSVTITYQDDGSRKQGVGGYSVQGVHINGKFFPFPSLKISSETRSNLADLKLTILQLLAVCGGVTAQSLWDKVDFIMTDSVSHNMEVETLVSDTLDTEHTPDHLVCQVHPSLMFSRVMTDTWREIDQSIGPDKIFAGFCVKINKDQVSVTENWVDCILRLVSHDFDHKMWNKAEEFDIFISPKKNAAKRLQKERFNSLVYCCAVSLNLDEDVYKFLLKYDNITNQLACIVRSFEDLEYVRVLAASRAILGIHLIEPFISLTSSSVTDYKKLVESFPQLYIDLTSTPSRLFLDISKPALKFISKERFDQVKYPDELLVGLKQVVELYSDQLVSVLDILLPRLAKGWEVQRGGQFQFGENVDRCAPNQIRHMDQEKLVGAPINNLAPERAVGFINHELKFRGAKQLGAASRAHVKGKGIELIEGKEMPAKFKKLTSTDGNFAQIMQQWEEKQLELRKARMGDKEIQNLAVEKRKNCDLTQLTSVGGPFTKADQVDEYMSEQMDEKKRNQRLYLEVRYARDTSLAFPKTSDIFKLKKHYRNLDSSVYAGNLKAYLNKLVCHVNMEMVDFLDAISKLNSD